MKGLLQKDFLNQRTYLKSTGLVVLMFLLIGLLQRSAESVVILLSTMLMVFTMVASINSLALDEACKWNCYAAAMPLKRSDIVRGKYLLFSLQAVGGGAALALIGLAVSLFFTIDRGLLLLVVGGMVLLSLLLLAIILPLVYKFGTEKARFFIILIALLPTLAIILLQTAGFANPFASGAIDWASAIGLAWVPPLLVLALLFGSYALSARIFAHKDL